MKAPKTQILFLTAAIMFAAAVLRLTWVEDQTSAELCRTAVETPVCVARSVLVQAFHFQIFGWVGLVLGFVGLLRPHLLLAALTLMSAGLALIFYTTDLGAGGFVLGLMGLARATVARSGSSFRSLG